MRVGPYLTEVTVRPGSSAAGKTLKREMREPYWAGKERNI